MFKTIPSSRAYFRARISHFDVVLALIAPPLAICLRDTPISDADYVSVVGAYWALTSALTICGLVAFRLQDGMKRYFSVHDALDVLKAVVFIELISCLVLFSVTRLDGIPRTTLLIHGLILAGGLVMIRAFARLLEPEPVAPRNKHASAEHVLVIGSNHLSSLFIKLMGASSSCQRVVGSLDDDTAMIGRAIAGVPIVGTPHDLSRVIEEFAVHGVQIDRVVVSGGEEMLSKPALEEVQRECHKREIRLDFIPQLLGLESKRAAHAELTLADDVAVPRIAVPGYFRMRRAIDFVLAAVAAALLLPLIVCVAGLVMLDVGSPVLFWQQRLGRGGRPFLVYKFRTLQAPFDRNGRPMNEYQRQSAIGYMLRKTGLDELPQLLNVLIGDMSLIGPRPLLPHDQPPNPTVRLLVRPGITGWAQVNGAKSLTPLEKDQLDEFYIRNGSWRLDLRIVYLTLKYVLTGERRSLADLIGDGAIKPSPMRLRKERQDADRKVA